MEISHHISSFVSLYFKLKLIVHKRMLFLFLKQCARLILSFANNELITSYWSERVPSTFIRQKSDDKTHGTIFHPTYHSTFCRTVCYGHKNILYLYFFQSDTLKILFMGWNCLKESKVLYLYLFSLTSDPDLCRQFINQWAYQKKLALA